MSLLNVCSNKFATLGALLLITFSSFAKETYYGKQFFQSWPSEETVFLENAEPSTHFKFNSLNTSLTFSLRNLVHKILAGGHVVNGNDYDTIVDNCSQTNSLKCIQHTALSYREARAAMFGHLHLEQDFANNYKVKSVYCNKYYTRDDFPEDQGPGPGQIPHHTILNAEHTWPQSKFSTEDKEFQKADLNILFPVESRVNSTRSNRPFGEVATITSEPCEGAKLGKHPSTGNELIFEPPNSHKGNVARAMFYFSIRYKMQIDPVQERILRSWHIKDPVDQQERERHEDAFDLQLVRNPFIDFPELADKFSDF